MSFNMEINIKFFTWNAHFLVIHSSQVYILGYECGVPRIQQLFASRLNSYILESSVSLSFF